MARVKSLERWGLYRSILTSKASSHNISIGTDHGQLLQLLEDIQAKAESSQRGRFRALKDVSLKIIQLLSTVKDAGGAVAALNPYASLAWSSIQFLLQAATTNHEIEQLCWTELPRLTSLISRYQTIEEVYILPSGSRKSQRFLEDALVGLYESLLLYQVEAVIFAGSRMERFKAAFKGVEDSTLQHTLDTIRDQEAGVAMNLAVVGREIDSGHFQRLETVNQALQDAVSSLEDMVQQSSLDINEIASFVEEERYSQIISWISGYMFGTSHQKAEKTGLEGTGTWLQVDPDFLAWRRTGLPSAFWLRGFMGSGKSCLTNRVVKTMQQDLDKDRLERLAYFYCDSTDPLSRAECSSSNKILRCILKQLSLTYRRHCLPPQLVALWAEKNMIAEITNAECIQLIDSIVSESSLVMVIIDGLDECGFEVERELTAAFRTLMSMSTRTLKTFVSGRPSVETSMRSLNAIEIDVKDRNEADLKLYIQTTVAEARSDPHLRRLYVKDESGAVSRSNEVSSLINTQAQGMFRWARMAFTYLHQSKYFAAMTRRMRELPNIHGLFDLYDTIWRNVYECLDEPDRLLVKTTILFTMYGLSPPSDRARRDADMMCDDRGVEYVGPAAWFAATRESQGPIGVTEIIALLPDFVEYREGPCEHWHGGLYQSGELENHLGFQHFSVREYLMQRHGDEYSELQGQKFITKICIEQWLKSGGDYTHFTEYSGIRWAEHLLRLTKASPNGLIRLLNEDAAFSGVVKAFFGERNASARWCRWSSWLVNRAGGRSASPSGKFLCLDFATDPCSTIFARILFGLPINQLNDSALAADCIQLEQRQGQNQSAIQYAESCGNSSAVQVLKSRLKAKADHTSVNLESGSNSQLVAGPLQTILVGKGGNDNDAETTDSDSISMD